MNAVEFTTELTGAAVLPIPAAIAAQLPRTGKARIIMLTEEHSDDADWRAGAYEQFLRDDPQEDAIYDSCRYVRRNLPLSVPVHVGAMDLPRLDFAS
jgi:hypothetical protein